MGKKFPLTVSETVSYNREVKQTDNHMETSTARSIAAKLELSQAEMFSILEKLERLSNKEIKSMVTALMAEIKD